MPTGKVTKVIDGDTLKVAGQKKPLRLANVEAPEIGTKGAAGAKHKLESLVRGQKIDYTQEAMSYDRIVAKVQVGGKSINRAMQAFLK